MIIHSYKKEDQNLDATLTLCKEFDIVPVEIWIGDFNTMEQEYKRWEAGKRCRETDWIINADTDEFIELPSGFSKVNDFTSYCDSNGHTYVEGEFIDRISADGTFKHITKDDKIFSQFPVRSHITRDIIGGCTAKIPIMRGDMKTIPGHHFIDVNHGKVFNKYPRILNVHHFKWDATVVERLSVFGSDEELKKCDIHYHNETKKFVDYANQHGRIDMKYIK